MTTQGYRHTEEARERIAEASRNRQRKPLTDEQRAKIRDATRAAMQRPEVKAKLAAAAKTQPRPKCPEGCACGRHNGTWTGKKRPELASNGPWQPNLRHGHTWHDPITGESRVSPTYKSWQGMRYRCRKKHGYADRGITVCDRWQVFENFLADMGERPGLAYSIDRIDVNGNYEPGNCRWATRSEQQRNRRPMPDQPNQYSTGKAAVRVNECGHPDRPHRAKGMCSACYQQDRKHGK